MKLEARTYAILKQYLGGRKQDDIAKLHGVTRTTVIDHLHRAAEAYPGLDWAIQQIAAVHKLEGRGEAA